MWAAYDEIWTTVHFKEALTNLIFMSLVHVKGHMEVYQTYFQNKRTISRHLKGILFIPIFFIFTFFYLPFSPTLLFPIWMFTYIYWFTDTYIYTLGKQVFQQIDPDLHLRREQTAKWFCFVLTSVEIRLYSRISNIK